MYLFISILYFEYLDVAITTWSQISKEPNLETSSIEYHFLVISYKLLLIDFRIELCT